MPRKSKSSSSSAPPAPAPASAASPSSDPNAFHFSGSGEFSAGTNRSVSLSSSLEKAEELLIQSEPDKAIDLLLPLLKANPNSLELIDLIIECYMTLGPYFADKAHSLLTRSIQLAPDASHMKWMYLGQLIEPDKAVEAYRKGINILQNSLNAMKVQLETANRQGEDADQLKSDIQNSVNELCDALVAVAELYMTPPCCDLPEAEKECESALSSAVDISRGQHLEALSTLASLRLIQQRDDEAREAIDRCLARLQEIKPANLSQLPAVSIVSGGSIDDSLLDSGAAYSTRVNIAKSCLELGKNKEALNILEELVEEDEDIIEVQHLFAVALFHCGEFDDSLDRIEICMEKCKSAGERQMDQEQDNQEDEEQEDLSGVVRALEELRENCKKEKIKRGDSQIQEEEKDELELIEDEEENEKGMDD